MGKYSGYCESCGRVVPAHDLRPQRDSEDGCMYDMCSSCKQRHQDRIQAVIDAVTEE